jgi:hypothetical protein
MAYQTFMLMWARQFLTTFTFTFMPELYPGGIVAFPDHGIQTYIDEVYHSFDYENGFTTQANMSAPSAIKGRADSSKVSQGMIIEGALTNPRAIGGDNPGGDIQGPHHDDTSGGAIAPR